MKGFSYFLNFMFFNMHVCMNMCPQAFKKVMKVSPKLREAWLETIYTEVPQLSREKISLSLFF